MLAILHGVKQISHDQTVYEFRFADANDDTVSPASVIDLAGYEIAGTGSALADTDTLLEAIGKLEKRIDTLENV